MSCLGTKKDRTIFSNHQTKKKPSGAGTYTKKSNTHNLPPSSSSSSANSATGLISKLLKQANTKKLHKILWRLDQCKKFSRTGTLPCHRQNFLYLDRASIIYISMSNNHIHRQNIKIVYWSFPNRQTLKNYENIFYLSG